MNLAHDPKLTRADHSEEIGFYEKRKGVFPRGSDGPFRRLKWAIMAFCLIVYWGTPWLRWNRGPYAPDQAVLVDLAHRRFYMFQIEIWPHEFYFVAGLLIMAGIGLFLVTSAVGRAWCGYACPQTVWTDLFQHVDRLIDGDRNAQIRLQNAPWTPAKIARRTFKWGVYLAISFLTGGAWIFYFADAPTLQREFWTGTAAPVAYATTAVLTFTTFWLGGFMREQVCIYMCPWPRIQTAMLDERSLTVTYKDWRGEPRGSVKAAQKRVESGLDPLGDCIDCKQCIAVCPTGIDIREGPQIGCITCALCIDACDKAMADVGRPRGLIDYFTLEDADKVKRGEAPTPVLRTIFRPRTLVYFGVWAGIGVAMLFLLGSRTRLDLSVAKDRNPEYVMLSKGEVRNGFTVKLRNMEDRPRPVTLSIEGLPGGAIFTDEMDAALARTVLSVEVPADTTKRMRVYAIVPKGAKPAEFLFQIKALDKEGGQDSVRTTFTTAEGNGQ
ncbi:cytochrome c oxidase accessory protein CcoG [Novosphingobium olei]|uniref:cytochrome c oxidase accessory protein CcoG n=1 Tax=Novosphingobium olei TaxID=2728851 RepID=UPI00308E263A|nr:cytochrome c oxidase accessory protein CcoG [Novosphingobium olei]